MEIEARSRRREPAWFAVAAGVLWAFAFLALVLQAYVVWHFIAKFW